MLGTMSTMGTTMRKGEVDRERGWWGTTSTHAGNDEHVPFEKGGDERPRRARPFPPTAGNPTTTTTATSTLLSGDGERLALGEGTRVVVDDDDDDDGDDKLGGEDGDDDDEGRERGGTTTTAVAVLPPTTRPPPPGSVQSHPPFGPKSWQRT